MSLEIHWSKSFHISTTYPTVIYTRNEPEKYTYISQKLM